MEPFNSYVTSTFDNSLVFAEQDVTIQNDSLEELYLPVYNISQEPPEFYSYPLFTSTLAMNARNVTQKPSEYGFWCSDIGDSFSSDNGILVGTNVFSIVNSCGSYLCREAALPPFPLITSYSSQHFEDNYFSRDASLTTFATSPTIDTNNLSASDFLPNVQQRKISGSPLVDSCFDIDSRLESSSVENDSFNTEDIIDPHTFCLNIESFDLATLLNHSTNLEFISPSEIFSPSDIPANSSASSSFTIASDISYPTTDSDSPSPHKIQLPQKRAHPEEFFSVKENVDEEEGSKTKRRRL
ncbi:13105_t:CDS:1 [Acaulospora morrowiae]|uniref:13105_t:CDS:1 n=1 Tax=Acaulospora morrowiae TaxID=94023 RepID=A0A9N9NEE7_9GLOM|nr:13105_t:CDS:1 [Acaulospora morrowiae]